MLPAYEAWRAGTSNSVVVPARQAGNRFLGSLKGYDSGLGEGVGGNIVSYFIGLAHPVQLIQRQRLPHTLSLLLTSQYLSAMGAEVDGHILHTQRQFTFK
jgi:hypothetical protein